MSIKNFTSILLLISTGCVSLISQRSDEEAWMEYQKESRMQAESDSRIPASSDVAQIRTSQKILRQILQELPFRNFLVSCESADCYQSKLVFAFDEIYRRVKAEDVSLSPDDYKNEQKRFIEENGYVNMLKKVDGFHRMLFSGVELRASTRAADLAHVCESSIDSEEKVQLTEFGPYTGGTTYLPKTYYACINSHWKSELDQLLKETCERLGVVIRTEEARNWILEKQIYPIYQKTLSELFQKRKMEEQRGWQQEWVEIEKVIDWKISVAERVAKYSPELRKKYPFLNVESLLAESKPSKI